MSRTAPIVLCAIVMLLTLHGGTDLYARSHQQISTATGRILSDLTFDRDTIDFGYSMAGNDSAFIYHSLFIINDGTEQLVVRDTDLSLESIAPTNSKTEFSFPAGFPLLIDTVYRIDAPFQYAIRCQATTFLKDAPEGLNFARLTIRLSKPRNGQADSVVARRVFILRFVKTLRPLWTAQLLNLDSVYVHPTSVQNATITFRNADLKRSVKVDDSLSIVLSGKREHVSLLSTPLLLIARDSAKAHDISVQYAPTTRGLDSMEFGFIHFNPSTLRNGTDTTRLLIRGVGVEQDLRLQSVRGKRATINGDTIELGTFTVGYSDTTTLNFANNGNIPFFSHVSMQDVVNGSTTHLSVIDSLHKNGQHIVPGGSDSLRIVFSSNDVATYLVKCTLHSDIATRAHGTPDSVRDIVLYLRAAARPRVVSTQSTVMEFDSVAVFSDCPASRSLTLRLRNNSSALVHIQSCRVEPSPSVFSSNISQVDINPVSDQLISVTFSPSFVGHADATLLIQSDVDDIGISIPLSGWGVEPREMKLRLPQEMRVFPGHQISIPLIAEKELLVLAQRFRASVVYDSSILSFDHYDKVGTASAAATSIICMAEPGRVQCSIELPDSFHDRDTLINLVFNSFLGYHDRTDVSVQSPAFGRGPCERIMPAQSPTAILFLDSLCGLQYKLPRGPVPVFELSTPSPNPAVQSTSVVARIAFTTHVQIIVCNSIGEQVATICDRVCDPGLMYLPLELHEFAEGSYTIHMQAGIFKGVQRLVVSH